MTTPVVLPVKILLTEAAVRCGYARVNTMREKHLATGAQKVAMGHEYDGLGRVLVDEAAVLELAARLHAERQERGEWRSKNLGRYAKKGGGRRKPTAPRARRKPKDAEPPTATA